MRIKQQPKIVMDLINELLELPTSHIGNSGCPRYKAVEITEDYLTRDMNTGTMSGDHDAKTFIQELLFYLWSVYDDGRVCPMGEINWFLRKLYVETAGKSVRHMWYTIHNVVRTAILIGAIEFEEKTTKH